MSALAWFAGGVITGLAMLLPLSCAAARYLNRVTQTKSVIPPAHICPEVARG